MVIKGCVLTPPPNVELIDNPSSIWWFSHDGILYSISKDAPPLSIEESKKIFDEFRIVNNGKKFCLLLDITHAKANDRETREFAAQEFPKITKAMAMVSASPLGRMVGSIFLALKPTPYPAKIFNNEKDAVLWLKQYL